MEGKIKTKLILDGSENFNISIGDKIFTTEEAIANMKQETKMTREEAIKIAEKNYVGMGMIDTLEALGLIKFDKSAYIPIISIEDIDGDIQRVKINNAIRALENAGYKVTT